jgi:Xaa-Pro dipeptidase
MLSRRRFLFSGVMTAGAALGPAEALAGPASAGPPAPIARLASRRGEVKPIGRAEREARQAKARQLAADAGLDAVILAEGSSLNYFTGVRWWGSERLFAMVLPARGAPFYVCPAFEEGRAREQLAGSTDAAQADIRVWQEDQDPYDLLARGLRDRRLATGRLGIEENVRYVFTDGIARATPQAHLTSATLVTAGCRMVKSKAEIALQRLASEVTLAAYEATYRSLKAGMSQQDISELTRLAHERLGFEGAADLVLLGESAAFPHGSTAPQVLRDGSIVLMDGGCEVEGYKSDITRTFVFGRATARMNGVFATVLRAQSAALAAAKPGAACGAVDAAARDVIAAAGFGPNYRYFTHRLGHGIGLDGHEWPYLVRGNATPLKPGMTTSNEPGIYLRGEFGIRLEDEMLITADGAELYTPQSRSLEDPFGRATA